MNFRLIGVNLNLSEEFLNVVGDVFVFALLDQEHQELEDAENIIFLREGDVGVEITRKDEFIAFGHKAVDDEAHELALELPDFCL
jgi:hypothetical protein